MKRPSIILVLLLTLHSPGLLFAGSVPIVGLFGADIVIPTCDDSDGDGYGDPDSLDCTYPELDCNDDPSDDPSICDTCTCGIVACAACARCQHPGATDFCGDGIDSDCDGVEPYPCPANRIAITYGKKSLLGSGAFNGLALLLVPIGAVIFLRIMRRKK